MTDAPVVLLDRDGTIIAERHYLADPDGVELLPQAAAGLRQMQEAGCRLLVITNQSGVGRGYFTAQDMQAVHRRMQDLLAAEGVRLEGIYACPHTPGEGCACRKPRTGLVEQAVRDFKFDRARACMIGDKACDIDLGCAAGCRTLLVRTGYGRECEAEGACHPDAVVDDLREAAAWICGEEQ